MTDSAATESAPGSWADGFRAIIRRARAHCGAILADMRSALGRAIADQAPRAFVWNVVGFAAGIVLFFSWTVDPPTGLGLAVAGLGAGLLWLGRRSGRLKFAGLNFIGAGLIAIGAGHGAAELRTAIVATPLLTRSLPATEIHGRVAEAEIHPASGRILLENISIAGLAPDKTPVRLRLTLPAKSGLPRVGDRIILHATLRPPSRPALPDAFIFQRFLYFESVGGEGTAFGPWTAELLAPHDGWLDAFFADVEVVRRHVADRVATAISDRGDATTTAALIMGEQSAIPEDLQEAYRVSGLAHLLSISGVHMSLLAAVVFFLVRRGLALVPALALRMDTKKTAAWVAVVIATFYLLISGLSVPAIRSYLMIGVVLLAVLLDRTAISLRSIGWAALVLMAIYPDAVVGASFEMSFMAVLALIAVAEHVSLRVTWRSPDGHLLILRAIGVILAGAVVTDIAAGGSTALFAIYHFNRFPTYSMASNLVADPITGFWIMPWGLAAMLAMPFGLDQIPLRLMGYGVGLVNDVARGVAKWPGAQVHVPPMSAAALAVAAFGLMVLCLWRGRFRWAGLVLIIGGMAQPWFVTPPDVLIDEEAKVVAITDGQGHLAIRPGPGDRFIRDVWQERYGRSPENWPASGQTALDLRCDTDGCILQRRGKRVLLAFDDAALAEDCASADATVSLSAAYAFCKGASVADRIDLRRRGAMALWLTAGGVRHRFVADGMGDRRWAPLPKIPPKTESRDVASATADSVGPERRPPLAANQSRRIAPHIDRPSGLLDFPTAKA